jgi:hypothetical protein
VGKAAGVAKIMGACMGVCTVNTVPGVAITMRADEGVAITMRADEGVCIVFAVPEVAKIMGADTGVVEGVCSGLLASTSTPDGDLDESFWVPMIELFSELSSKREDRFWIESTPQFLLDTSGIFGKDRIIDNFVEDPPPVGKEDRVFEKDPPPTGKEDMVFFNICGDSATVG